VQSWCVAPTAPPIVIIIIIVVVIIIIIVIIIVIIMMIMTMIIIILIILIIIIRIIIINSVSILAQASFWLPFHSSSGIVYNPPVYARLRFVDAYRLRKTDPSTCSEGGEGKGACVLPAIRSDQRRTVLQGTLRIGRK